MARKIICDRCGEEIMVPGTFFEIGIQKIQTKEKDIHCWTGFEDITHCDLCEDCTDEVLMLIGGPEE